MIDSAADAHGHIQWVVSLVKMVDVLEEYSTEEQRPVMGFLWAKGPTGKYVHKEMIPVYSEKCLSLKLDQEIVSRTFESHRWCPITCGSG
jgi:hypothetical protein